MNVGDGHLGWCSLLGIGCQVVKDKNKALLGWGCKNVEAMVYNAKWEPTKVSILQERAWDAITTWRQQMFFFMSFSLLGVKKG
jgi:hypothetical protein